MKMMSVKLILFVRMVFQNSIKEINNDTVGACLFFAGL